MRSKIRQAGSWTGRTKREGWTKASKSGERRRGDVARGRRSRVRYVAIYGRLSRDKSLYMRPHRCGPLYETPSGAPHGITLIPLWPTYTGEEKSLRCYADPLLEIENKWEVNGSRSRPGIPLSLSGNRRLMGLGISLMVAPPEPCR